ncbi:hypothetical protein AB0A77_31280 [Streptomyces varsoviensis]|uniref:hypothetical protein n=1 Tax=Streptomyces varsoviensis TaxID=67373 RepID=UPI0033FF5A2E
MRRRFARFGAAVAVMAACVLSVAPAQAAEPTVKGRVDIVYHGCDATGCKVLRHVKLTDPAKKCYPLEKEPAGTDFVEWTNDTPVYLALTTDAKCENLDTALHDHSAITVGAKRFNSFFVG